MAYLGIDLGSSGLRVLLVGADGAVIATTERAYGFSHPHRGWSEQDPKDWITALEDAVAELRAKHPAFQSLRGIAVSGHMHGAVLLDQDGAVLRPCIMWNDTRSEAEAAILDQTAGVRELSGNIVFPGFTAPKLRWVERHEPETFTKVAKVLLPAAYLNFYLTGGYVSDLSDASGTSWLDVGARCWSSDLLAAGGMRRDQMAEVVEGSAPGGQLREILRRDWGLAGPVVVAGGAGDNAAAACGIGALGEGQGFVSLGTSGVLMAARDGYFPAPDTALHTFCHAVPGRWYQMGVMLSAASSLGWFAGICGATPAELTGALPETLRDPARVQFLPYLSGERTPHNDANIRGGFLGLEAASTRLDMTQAILEGVAFGLRDSLEALQSTGAQLDQVMAVGGGVASPYWLRLIATCLDVPLTLPEGGAFGAALGAARLAIAADTGANPEAVMTPPKARAVIDPDAEKAAQYDAAYQNFRTLYPAIKTLR
ncbi:xylulokinase [Epibacterium ulvae]|uniref:xylulokinase n=1 Tax=Epibacterium ulvae TaxID=1156985 RepID=UPI001BFC0BA6|nr:xylulokinase [Epibacterium ulvae]MBT8152518.1 xylulokinase [Epibacterium ulvae]